MRRAAPLYVFVLAVSLLSGCGTTGSTRSQGYRSGPSAPSSGGRSAAPDPVPEGPGSPIPPPPAPPAVGVSHVKQVGFLRVFGLGKKTRQAPCAADTCATEGDCTQSRPARRRGLFSCLPGWNGCGLFGRRDDSLTQCGDDFCAEEYDTCGHSDSACGTRASCADEDACADPGFAEGCFEDHHTSAVHGGAKDHTPALADPFLGDLAEPLTAADEDLFDFDDQSVYPTTQPQAEVPSAPQSPIQSPYTEISSEQTVDQYFPAPAWKQRTIVEPPRWHRSPGRPHRTISHQVHLAPFDPQANSTSQPILIQPRQAP